MPIAVLASRTDVGNVMTNLTHSRLACAYLLRAQHSQPSLGCYVAVRRYAYEVILRTVAALPRWCTAHILLSMRTWNTSS
eukprot:5881768-Karenia_brevis.AAC.1